MKKILVIALAMLMVGAATATAADVSFSGSYYVRGKLGDNRGGWSTDTDAYGVYDHEYELSMNFKISDNLKMITRFEMVDENWGTSGAVNSDAQTAFANDDNIDIERAYGSYKFANGWTLDFGMMAAGAWAYDFGNTGNEEYRLKLVIPVPIGLVIPILAKEDNGETGNDANGDDNDTDAYIVANIFKLGWLDWKPLFVYVDGSDALDHEVFVTSQAFGANFDGWGFESEINFSDVSVGGADWSVWGLYLQAWVNLTEQATLGGFIAWGEYDDDTGRVYSFGDDFDGCGAQLIGNEFAFGGTDAIGGATYVGAYLNYVVNEKLNLKPFFSYVNSGYDDNSILDGASAWELSITGNYKISGNLTYSFGAGWADIDVDAPFTDPDSATVLWHRLKLTF